MKKTFAFASLVFFFCFAQTAFAQITDSLAAARHVDSLIQACRTLTGQAKYNEAFQVIETAKKKAREAFGVESAWNAACLYNQGRAFHFKGQFEPAESLYLEAKTIREKVLGKEHPDYAQSLHTLAMLHASKREYDEAETYYLGAIAIRENAVGKERRDYAFSLSGLANVYFDKYDYDKAARYYQEALVIWEKLIGKENQQYAQTLNDLANVYKDKGEYDIAETLYLEVKGIQERVLGKEHLDYFRTLNNLGNVYSDKGEYDEALRSYLEAKAILEKVSGKENSDYAHILNNLGVVYTDIGLYDKALMLHLEAKTIREELLGKENPDYAQTLFNLANIYHFKGNYPEAIRLHLESKAIWEKTEGKAHSINANCLNSLACDYRQIAEYDKAIELLLEANIIWVNILGEAHPLYARSLNNLANNYLDKGENDKALQLFLEAKTIQEVVLGKEHPDYASSLNHLASTYWDKRDRSMAATYFLSSNIATKSLLQKSASYSSEKEMLQYQALFGERFHTLLCFTQTYPTDSLIFAAYDNALFFKNSLLNAAIGLGKNIARADSSTRALYSEWKSSLFQLNKWYSRPIPERDSGIVARLEDKASMNEKELIRLSPAFVASRRAVTWREVRDRLHQGEAAVEFIYYRCESAKKDSEGSRTSLTDSTIYIALVLLPGDTVAHFIPLFEERQLQNLLPDVKEQYVVRDLYANKRDLFRLMLEPIMPLLSDAKTVYFSPSGLIHLLNPGALEDEDSLWISENRSWVRLGSTGELVTRTLADQSFAIENLEPLTAAVFGGIQYDIENEQDSLAFAAVNPLDIAYTSQIQFRNDGIFTLAVKGQHFKLQNRSEVEDHWDFLPMTRHEANETAEILEKAGFQVEKFRDYSASEERLKMISTSSPRILHIATHGFAYPDPKRNSATRRAFGDDELPFKLSDNPMLRSGLLFAGANFYWKKHRPLTDRDDGVLVAYEVRDLDLQNTELAVLSACQTGLGEAVGSEGIYGLQRAFKIAGAKFLLVSLWHVPDEQTREMMQLFYQNWLSATERLSLREAFERAQRQMREKYDDPFFWAGFVLVE